jgi:hypothetical protein
VGLGLHQNVGGLRFVRLRLRKKLMHLLPEMMAFFFLGAGLRETLGGRDRIR